MASPPPSLPPPPSSPPPPFDSKPRYFPEKAWMTLAACLVIVGLCQWGSVLHSKMAQTRRPRKRADEESTHTASASPARGRGWSTTRLPLAAVNVFRVVSFRWTLELGTYDFKVAEVFLTLAYIAFLLTWTFVGQTELGVSKMDVREWSGRAGLIAACQFPFVTALGTKNNIVSLVTGIGYEKLNYMHRVAARSCFGLLLIHVGGKIYGLLGVQGVLGATWLRLGITAMVSFTILIIVSLRAVRTRAYEIFFYTHFVTVFIFLLAAYFHTKVSDTTFWIWPSFMFWALDRLMRVVRVVVYNHLYFAFGRRGELQDAAIQLLGDDFVRVTARRPSHFQWSPGQTAYLIMPSVSAFPLEAHPFSISTVDSALFQPDTKDEHGVRWKELVFLINVRSGFTKRLRDYAVNGKKTKLLIDGPYGSAPDLGAYDTSILVAGGSGITYTLPVFLNVIEAATKGPSQCRRVVFIWAIRDTSHVHWISDALSRAHALKSPWLSVSIRIFITGGSSSNGGGSVGGASLPLSEISSVVESESRDKDRDTDKDDSTREWDLPPSVRLAYGRPELGAILRDEVNMATGRVSVTVCGSQSLTRSVRRAVQFPISGPRSVLNGGPSVTLHVESFGYA